MFFVASKLLWFVGSPLNLALLGVALGALFALRRRGRFWPAVGAASAAVLLIAAFSPAGAILVAPLEDRFPPPPADLAPPAGMIVLGGSIDDDASQARGQTIFDESGARLTEAAILARRFPAARVVYTGGSAAMNGDRSSREAEEAKRLLVALGLDAARITLEDRSRNTEENARFTAAIVPPRPGETWLLVTSAYHMPRAMALFRRAGFSVVAYPVDYRSLGDARDRRPPLDSGRAMRLFELATHEWTGLLAYWIAGKIDSPFPAP